jgi:hypothetical protein
VPLGGGGFSGSADLGVNINSSYPTSTGWHIDMNNNSTLSTTFNAYAVCAKKPKGYVQVAGSPVANPPGAQTSASADCPSQRAVPTGGGVWSTSGSVLVNMTATDPLYPDWSAWAVFEGNASAFSANLTPYAVCVGT